MWFDWESFGTVALIMFRAAWAFERSLGRVLLLLLAVALLPVSIPLGLLFAIRF